MKKLTRKNLNELAKIMPVISEIVQRSYIGGGDGSQDNPYTMQEFENMSASGTWNGGYVEGLGYTLSDVTCTASGRVVENFTDTNLHWYPAEGVGINGSFNVNGYSIIQDGHITICVNAQNLNLDPSTVTMGGSSVIRVDGVTVESGIFKLPDPSVYQTGTIPLGSVDFDLSKYHGYVEVEIFIGHQYDSGAGFSGSAYSRIVYSKYR